MSGDYENYLEEIIQNQEITINKIQTNIIQIGVIEFVICTILILIFISRCYK